MPVVFTSPRVIARPSGGINLRKHERLACGRHIRAVVVVEGQANPLSAEVYNISRGGISLVIGSKVDLDKNVLVNLQDSQGNSQLRSRARVVYIVNPPGGTHILGCAFINELPEEEIRKVM